MTNENAPTGSTHDTDSARIAKVIARAGLASRREAEVWIEAGRVAVNGETISSPAVNVGPRDKVTVDGKPLPARERTRLWLYHKPRGLVTTAKDPEGRTTVFDVLPPELPRVVSVGRLDLNTEGLLLLTNDGGLARVLAHPSTAWLRRYRVRAFGKIDQETLNRLRDGVEVEGFAYGPIEATLDRQQGDNSWLTLGLREGKNREVRKVLEHLGLMVNRLLRVSFGPFQLGDLGEGAVEEIRTRYLRDQLGSLAEEAECDFSAPIVDRTPEPVKRALRAHEEQAEAPRRRAGLTTDRKGRRVVIERVEKQKAEPKRDERLAARGRAPRPDRFEDESPRPFRARADRPERAPRDERPGPARDERRGPLGDRARGDRPDRPPRRDGESPRPFRSRGDRPQRDDRRGPPRDRPHGERPGRPPRRDGDSPRPFRSRDDRPPRGERPDRPPRREGDSPRPFRARGERPERSERPQEPRPDGNRLRVFRAKPDRPPREDRPTRDDRRGPPRERDSRPPRDRDSRPPRRDGDKPRGFGGKPEGRGGKPGGGRPSGPGRPGGRPSGPPRGKPGGGRPGGRPPRPRS